jgi:DNA-binding Lrp family transcriptional regulator
MRIQGISEVYSVAGDYDLVVVARVRESEDPAKLVAEEMTNVKGITKTLTLISFRQYSQYDLERMFGVGE